jgi:hypothetical protein
MSDEKRSMLKYTVLERSLVGNEIFEAGSTCLYDGLPAENLAPQCDEGKARYQEYLASNRDRVAKMVEQNAEPGVGDSAVFFKALQAQRAQDHAEMPGLIAAAVAAAIAQVFPNGTSKKAETPLA